MSPDRLPEDELRALLRDGTPPPAALDVDSIVGKATRRRRPRQIGAGIVGTLAIVGIVAVGVQTLPGSNLTSASMTDGAATAPESLEYSAVPLEPNPVSGGNSAPNTEQYAGAAPVCGAPLLPAMPTVGSLDLTADMPGTADGTVILNNRSARDVIGAASVTVLVSRDGIIVGIGDGESVAVTVPAAGSIELAASIDAIGCDALPLPEGSYDLSTRVEIDLGPGITTLSTIPVPVELR